jgi:hypothetical protein
MIHRTRCGSVAWLLMVSAHKNSSEQSTRSTLWEISPRDEVLMCSRDGSGPPW